MALGDEYLADEVAARLIDYTPTKPFEAQLILDILDTSDETNNRIVDAFQQCFKNIQASSKEKLSHNINLCVKALQAKANNEDVTDIKKQLSEDWMDTNTLHYLGILLSSVEAAKDMESAYYRMIEMIKRLE